MKMKKKHHTKAAATKPAQVLGWVDQKKTLRPPVEQKEKIREICEKAWQPKGN